MLPAAVTSRAGGSFVVRAGVNTTVPDGQTAPATLQKLAFAHAGGDNRPHDAYTLRTLVRNTNTVAARYPRTLACHSFVLSVIERTLEFPPADYTVRAEYRVRRGPNAGNCTL